MAGDASFFRIGSGEGLSELVMEFPAVLGVFLNKKHSREPFGAEKTMTATDVTGFDAIFSTGFFATFSRF